MKQFLILVGAAALLLAACGGVEEDVDISASVAAADSKPVATGDSVGRLLAAGSVTRAQEIELAQTFGGRVLRVSARPGGEDTLAEDVGLVLLQQMAHKLPDDTPVFVTAEDLPRAYELADRLKAAGLTRVVLVTG